MSTSTSGLRGGAFVCALWGLAACGEPSADGPSPAATQDPPAASATPNVAELPPPQPRDPSACRDWSTLDPTTLPPLPAGKHVALFEAVWDRVRQTHFDPTLGCLDWSAHRMGYGRAVAEASTDAEAYAEIDALLQQLGHSHITLFPPTATKDDAIGPASPPITVRWIEDQLVVVHVAAPIEGSAVVAGATVLAIEGEPVERWIGAVQAEHEDREHAAALARRAAAKLSCARQGESRSVEVMGPSSDTPTTATLTCVVPEGKRVTLGNLRNVPTRVEHRMLGDTPIGLIAFNVWMLPMVQRVRTAMTQLREQGMQALILDLRGNPGGVGAMVVPVARLLLDHPASLGTMRFREFEQTLNVEPSSDPAEPPFTGPVVVLVDERTASTSEIFVLGLRDLGRIKVVAGHASAGAALPSLIEQMPGDALLQTVVADYRSPSGAVAEGRGIAPDIVVPETQSGFSDGGDPVLSAARRYLGRVLTGEVAWGD